MISLTRRLTSPPEPPVHAQLALTAEERTRSRHWFETESGQAVYLQLPRGTLLHHGDILTDAEGAMVVRVVARPEPVITVRAATPLLLLRAAYHLGNRHIALEVTNSYLRFCPDSVLQDMLQRMGLTLTEEIAPFQPESGAYGDRHSSHSYSPSHHHSHSHDSSHSHDHRHSPDHPHHPGPGASHQQNPLMNP